MIKKRNKPPRVISVTKTVSVIIMYIGLLLLTGANFFMYKSGLQTEKVSPLNDDSHENKAPNPAEEHPKSNQALYIQEDYLHEKYSHGNFTWRTLLFYHKIGEAEKLQVVHCELISPPPKLL